MDALKSIGLVWWLFGLFLAFQIWWFAMAFRDLRRAAPEASEGEFATRRLPLFFLATMVFCVLLFLSTAVTLHGTGHGLSVDALKSPDWYWWLYGSHLAFTMWCYTVAYRHARRAALEGTPPSDFCA
ncbi:MAG TPA: hypothetical protein VLH79_08770, partial [Chthonomonadales bacterium]|nr:hypothetical protein [Chthonomonadales bacterium]